MFCTRSLCCIVLHSFFETGSLAKPLPPKNLAWCKTDPPSTWRCSSTKCIMSSNQPQTFSLRLRALLTPSLQHHTVTPVHSRREMERCCQPQVSTVIFGFFHHLLHKRLISFDLFYSIWHVPFAARESIDPWRLSGKL